MSFPPPPSAAMGAALSCVRAPDAERGSNKDPSLLVARPLGRCNDADAKANPQRRRSASMENVASSSSKQQQQQRQQQLPARPTSPTSVASGPGSDVSFLQWNDSAAAEKKADKREDAVVDADDADDVDNVAEGGGGEGGGENVIGGGIFKAISDAASQADPMQGRPLDSYEYGPPRPPCNAERVAELRSLCADDLCPGAEGGGGGGGAKEAESDGGSSSVPPLSTTTAASSEATDAAATAARLARKTKGGAVLSFAAPNPHIEHIISLICRLFNVEDALLALLDGERVFIRDAAGKKFRRGDFPWSCSFCGWSLASPTPQTLIVPDAREDARFDQNPFVKGPPFMRFYAGAPVVGRSGHRLGTLCFADVKPRALGPAGAATLNTLAELVAVEIERDAAARAAAAAAERVTAAGRAGAAMRALELGGCGALLVDTRGCRGSSGGDDGDGGGPKKRAPTWTVLHASADAAAALGLGADLGGHAADGLDFWELFEPPKLRGGVSRGVSDNVGNGSASSGRRDPLARLQAAADSGRFFSVRGARAKRGNVASDAAAAAAVPAKDSSATTASAAATNQTRLFDLSFWPSALGPPGDLPAVGVPAAIAGGSSGNGSKGGGIVSAASSPAPTTSGGSTGNSGSSGSLGGGGIYCVTLSLAFVAGASPLSTASAAAAFTSASISRPSTPVGSLFLPSEATLAASAPPPIPGLRLGVLVGKGAHGTVFCGSLRGVGTVAVKVVPDDARVPRSPDGTPLEALLSARLRHPNLVRMRAAARSAAPPGPHDSAGSFEGNSAAAPSALLAGGGAKESGGGGGVPAAAAAALGAGAAPGGVPAAARGATWMVMDFCGGGTLLDAAERGVLRSARAMARASGIVEEERQQEGSVSRSGETAASSQARRGVAGGGDCRRRSSSSLGRVSPAALAAAAADVAAGVLALHEAGFAHGDLTGTNVLLASAAALAAAEQEENGAGGQAPPVAGGKWRAVVADYGLAAPLAGARSGIFIDGNASSSSNGSGDVGCSGGSSPSSSSCDGEGISASAAAGWKPLSSFNGGARMNSGGSGGLVVNSASAAASVPPAPLQQHSVVLSTTTSASSSSPSSATNGFEHHPIPEAIVGAPPYGTVTHMAPEILASGSGPSASGDAWAFGVLLWELAHGCRAWASMSHAQVVAAVAVRRTLLKWDDVVREEVGGGGGPFGWAAKLARDCWNEDPEKRPSFAEICARLEGELERMRAASEARAARQGRDAAAPVAPAPLAAVPAASYRGSSNASLAQGAASFAMAERTK